MTFGFLILLQNFLACLPATGIFFPEQVKGGIDYSSSSEKFCVAFYNVENLFDAIDDPQTDDAEFTPSGRNKWTTEKYHAKLNNVVKVITGINGGRGADLLGLCEVENAGTVNDLISFKDLRTLGYTYLHEESPDIRGIDVCLLYKKKSFRVIGHKMLPVSVARWDDKPTRDIMMVKGIAGKNDTLFLFINHWPSRRGGTQESDPKREAAASVLRHAIDSILSLNPKAHLICMGDFNDNPTDKSVSTILNARIEPAFSERENHLYNTSAVFNWKNGEGSEFYKGDWSRFIQIIVSGSLLEDQLNRQNPSYDVHIFKPDWLLAPDPAYQEMVPRRMFGDSGEIGFSDHLPVYLMLKLN